MSQPTTTSNESTMTGESILSILSPQERTELPPRGDVDLPLAPIEPGHVVRAVAIPEGLHERILRDVRKLERIRRGERQLRQWSVWMTGLAASLLLVMLIQPFFGRPSLDSEALAGKLDSVHRLVLDNEAGLTSVRPTKAWPMAVDSTTCVGQKTVEFLGKQMPAYQLASGAERATLLIVPAAQFPFQLGKPYVTVMHSSLHLQAHYFVSGRQVCILIVRDGTDVRRFHRSESVT